MNGDKQMMYTLLHEMCHSISNKKQNDHENMWNAQKTKTKNHE